MSHTAHRAVATTAEQSHETEVSSSRLWGALWAEHRARRGREDRHRTKNGIRARRSAKKARNNAAQKTASARRWRCT